MKRGETNDPEISTSFADWTDLRAAVEDVTCLRAAEGSGLDGEGASAVSMLTQSDHVVDAIASQASYFVTCCREALLVSTSVFMSPSALFCCLLSFLRLLFLHG